VHSNTESLQVGFNGIEFISKHITSKIVIVFIKSNINMMILIFNYKCCICSKYIEFIQDISGSTRVPS